MPAWLESIFMGKPDRNRQLFANNTGSQRPTPRQQALWEAVQAAKRKGLPILRIAKVLRIKRETVRKYMAGATPPVYADRLLKQKKPETNLLTKSLNN